MSPPEGRSQAELHMECGMCALGPLCGSRAAATMPLRECRRRLAPGESLSPPASPRRTICALRTGVAKVTAEDAGGMQAHIVRFLLPGDAAGLESLSGGDGPTRVVAVTHCEACVISAENVEAASRSSGDILPPLSRLLARELASAESHAASLSSLTAAQRVAAFLLDLSRRWSARGYSGTLFGLPMGRRDIGCHLALTMETVSRMLSHFRRRGWIALPPGHVEILDPQALEAVVRAPDDAPAVRA